MGGGKALNAVLRKNASEALFPILRDLGIQAALTHKGALALHLNTNRAAKEIKVIVNHEDNVTLEGICAAVLSPRRSQCSNGYFTKSDGHLAHRLKFFPSDRAAEGKPCRVIFILNGGSSPTILEDFSEITRISGVPVLPIHAILLEQFIAHSRLPTPTRLSKGTAKFISQCLVACGRTPLQQLSPLWRSLDILAIIPQHVQVDPKAKKDWIARGIDHSVFTTAFSPSQDFPDVPDEAGRDIESDDDGSDRGASEDLSGIVQETLSVVPEEPDDHGHWHSVVSDFAARQVVSLLRGFGVECALVGSAASQLYSHGETPVPEQLEILALRGYVSLSPSLLKQSLFQACPSQFEWKKENLFYKFSGPTFLRSNRKCKVEILVPNTANPLNLASSNIIWIDDLPVVPFLTLLLSKLQLWGNDNSPTNAVDILDLLLLVPDLPVFMLRPWAARKGMSEKFQRDSEVRVKRFCSKSNFPEAGPTWEMLGFDIESD
ncbi:hypothetical protein MD484_g8669, partial [Candolleomyces efflorescens]